MQQESNTGCLPILRVRRAVFRELFFVLVADRQQLVLVNHVLAAILEMKLEYPGFTMESTGQDSSQKPQ